MTARDDAWFSDIDRACMALAIDQARLGFALTEPNPRVGCVLRGPDWQVMGHTQPAGQAHAEVMALRAAHSEGRDVRGCTAYVSLEPCAHHGRTPPCCDALIAAGVGRVVAAVGDPFPQVAGRGIERLRAAGITVDVGLMADEAREVNIGFFSRIQRGRPWVRMKIAASLDGRTALLNGKSQWITGEAARTDGHRWRRRASAVLTGAGTVLEDDPRLDVRLVPTPRQPLRVVVDSKLSVPPGARLFDADGPVLIYATLIEGERADALRERGAEVALAPGANGKVDLSAMLHDLAGRGVNELHVEAGHKLNASLLREDLVDELLVYLAPVLLGSGRDMAALGPLEALTDGLRFAFEQVDRIGDDLRLRARPPGRATF